MRVAENWGEQGADAGEQQRDVKRAQRDPKDALAIAEKAEENAHGDDRAEQIKPEVRRAVEHQAREEGAFGT